MKRYSKLATILFCTVQLSLISPLSGQNLSLDVIYGGIDDAEAILQEYLKPYANIMGANLTMIWRKWRIILSYRNGGMLANLA